MQFTSVRFNSAGLRHHFFVRVPEIASTTGLASLADDIFHMPPELYEMCRPLLPTFEARALWALLMIRRGRLDEMRHFIRSSPELRLHPQLVTAIFATPAFAGEVMTPPNLRPGNGLITYDNLVNVSLLAGNMASARRWAARRSQAVDAHRVAIMLHGTAFRLALDRPSAWLDLSPFTAQTRDQLTTWSDLIRDAEEGGRAGEAETLSRLRVEQDDMTLRLHWAAILEVVAGFL